MLLPRELSCFPLGTSSDMKFYHNDLIESTADLCFFTGVTALYSNFLAYCSALSDVHLPPNVTTVPHGCFQYCTAAEEIILHEGITDFAYRWNFRYCDKLKVLVWPSTLERITMETARDCPQLLCLICKSTNATGYNTNNSGMFQRANSNLKIYVPDESVATYKAAGGWSSYASRIFGKSDLPDEFKSYWP